MSNNEQSGGAEWGVLVSARTQPLPRRHPPDGPGATNPALGPYFSPKFWSQMNCLKQNCRKDWFCRGPLKRPERAAGVGQAAPLDISGSKGVTGHAAS